MSLIRVSQFYPHQIRDSDLIEACQENPSAIYLIVQLLVTHICTTLRKVPHKTSNEAVEEIFRRVVTEFQMASSQELPIVTTERLLLRPLRDSDADDVYALRSNSKVFYWKTPDDRIQSDKWLQDRLSDSLCMSYSVELLHLPDNTNRKVIGLTGAHHLPEIGYIFEPDHWGYGYATEALKAWIEMYWSRFPEGFPSVEEEQRGYLKALTGPDGIGSRGVLKKCGFRYMGTEEEQEKGGKVMLDKWRADGPEQRQKV